MRNTLMPALPVPIYLGPADLMMRHWLGEATPELDHLRADAACGGATSSREYSAG